MIEEKYIESLKTRIAKYIKMAQTKYEELLAKSKSITSFYDFNVEIDKLGDLIEDILYTKKQLAHLVNALPYCDCELRKLSPEEETELNHQRLLGDKKIIEEQMHIVETAISEISREVLIHRLTSKLELERFRLATQLGKINSDLRVYESAPDLTDGEIDIYINERNESFKGVIYLHNTGIEIGNIDYRHKCDSKWLGDIGYSIHPSYQGNHYAYKALKLIEILIAQKGVDKVTITVRKGNIPSIKTIEKFGGVLKETTLAEVLIYECDLNHILINSSETHAKNK